MCVCVGGAVTTQMTMYCIIKLVSLQVPKPTFIERLLRAGSGAPLRGLRHLLFGACVRCILRTGGLRHGELVLPRGWEVVGDAQPPPRLSR